jgi:signal transduction histidine kinase
MTNRWGKAEVEPKASMLARHACENAAGGVADAAGHRRDAVFDEMTHAVVNALNTIAAASELAVLLIARKEPAEAAEPLARIESECMRAARLLRDGRGLLAFKVEPVRDVVDIAALLNACADSFAGRVQIDVADALPALHGDANALRRAFTEILDNAFQFGANRVNVTVRRPTAAQVVRIEFRDDGPGLGVPVARLFDPFVTTQLAEHSGLGLALVAKIAAAHGGCAGVDDSPHGATFWIELPMRGN